MKRKVGQKNASSTSNDGFARGNFICNVTLVVIAIISCATYIAGNLISLYNYYETKNQNDIAISSDISIPSIIYSGTINNKGTMFDSIFKDNHDEEKNITNAPGFTINNLTIYNNGSYNASDVHISIVINKKAIDYTNQFIKDKNLNFEIIYNEDTYTTSIHQKSKNNDQSRLITTFAGKIQNIKKDSQATIEIPENLVFFIRLFAYLKSTYGDSFSLKYLQNPILIKIKSFGRGNKEVYKTLEAYMSDIMILNQSEKKTSFFALLQIGR